MRCTNCARPLDTAAVICDATTCTTCELARFEPKPEALRDRALTAVSTAYPDARARIDAAIRQVAARGGEFSANDVRELVPDVPGPLMGARFNAAAKAGLIQRVGYVPSTKASTHAHPVAQWKAAA